MRSLPRLSVLVIAAALVLSACGADPGLPAALYPNRTDSLVSLYALTGTPVTSPSGYLIVDRRVVRTDVVNAVFDFVFDIDTLGRAMLFPTGAVKLGRQSGAQRMSVDYDSLRYAPSGGYQVDSAIVLTVGSVVALHSRSVQCSFDFQPVHNYFAKLLVLAIDTTSGPTGRRIDLRILTDINCGYRGLEPGLPRS
ncbi:MAG TPA: hypothetical protein VKD28_14120 [Gemmatimonadales bacterium]|nr:hypothetical protein [Gemmatimonadales bacterium]